MKIRHVLFFLLLAGALFTGYIYHQLWGKALFGQEKTVYLPTGVNYQQALDSLFTDTDVTILFKKLAKRKNLARKIQAGRYVFPPNASANAVINQLRSGNQQALRLTLSTPKSLEDIAQKAALLLEPDSAQFMVELGKIDTELPSEINEKNILALYLPNTYELFWNTSAAAFRSRMIREYQNFWNAERRELASRKGLNPAEVSILASIVQAETQQYAEMPTVAGLYINRLKNNWKLQSDPTVIFAIKQTNPDFDPRRVLLKDLKYESPYNTYLHAGLPPGPISIPSIQAIEAVLKSEKHDHFYMCADPERPGYHNFAQNARQHEVNRQKYIRWMQQRGIRR